MQALSIVTTADNTAFVFSTTYRFQLYLPLVQKHDHTATVVVFLSDDSGLSMIAHVAAELEGSVQPRRDNILGGLRGGAHQDLDSHLREEILGTNTHTAGNHHLGASFLKPARQQPGLVGRRIDVLSPYNALSCLIHIDESEILAVSEMEAQLSVG